MSFNELHIYLSDLRDVLTADQGSVGLDESYNKIWSVYNKEAEKYDKALMESWMRDMKGVLLFAAIFSASLTAFIIESYKTLSPDSTDKIVVLLTRISEQISDLPVMNSSTNTLHLDTQTHPLTFAPTATSLLCNTLWFIGLFLSLTCALLATLVEQWARGFIQKIEGRAAPVMRAKILSYLHDGLRQFSMHTVVDLIPLLLQASVMMFFGGLVAFLIPINLILVAVTAVWMTLLVGAYSVLTILPVYFPHCPYRTPLSGILWHIVDTLKSASSHYFQETPVISSPGPSSSMMTQVFQAATQVSEESYQREVQALCWTAMSIADDQALECFIDGISDAI
ncbi:hypothetical protein B0H15DRAFT_788744, partial [Mycena belliarum]